ncbi:MAG TPA: 4Fe-4S binding protein [bacterium]|jgi:Pyruvate/2-oxoacid:ferredoxin oxidoreductase delta subunit|nr:4Fe-4S binding protein [bacterium]MDX9804975.1 4Fe-4S binding protein [bacterium]HNW16859.1 4Fe-4S binding protein [bacterium]HOB72591.1 4Fe-4S binding protein [bacterium]HOG43799.1 4Fe-4S binding protein [bacterium]
MKYRIIEGLCINCGACAAECPCEAVIQNEKEYQITVSLCIGCGQCAEVCPVDCIEKIDEQGE